MAKKDIDWSNLGFGYVKTDKRFVANYKNGAWDNGVITDDDKVVISECAGVLQYSQSCFEGMKAYTTENGHTVIFRPDMNASRMGTGYHLMVQVHHFISVHICSEAIQL